MEFNVSRLLKEPVGAVRDYTVAEQVKLSDLEEECWVQGEVHLLRTERGVLAQCSFQTSARCFCSRCLAPYQQPLGFTLEEECFSTVGRVSGQGLPISDPDSFTLDEHHILYLDEAFRQYLLTSLPMQPLCREGCLGLCPRCGADRNRAACTCPQESQDLRWSSLRRLSALSATRSREA
ncbi:MAG: DUF177 domain-containing protein [Dehalococcoidia bacterium]|nr:DUF177 domain-containing protein [Dehalococcoidia bacterium]